MLKNKDLITSHLKKKAQSKLSLSISAFAVIITSTGYLFNSNSSSQFIKILTQIRNLGKEKKKIIALKKYIKKNHSKDHSEQYLKLIF